MEEPHRKLLLDLALVYTHQLLVRTLMALFRAGMKQRKSPVTMLVVRGKKALIKES